MDVEATPVDLSQLVTATKRTCDENGNVEACHATRLRYELYDDKATLQQ